MKTNKINIDFDFIGGQGSLTQIEEKQLSDYFKGKKNAKSNKSRHQFSAAFNSKSIN